MALACTPTTPASKPVDADAELAAEPNPKGPSTAKTREIASTGLVSAQFVPQYDSVARSGGSQTLNVMIRLTADDQDADIERPPLDLAIVLDRSGSMSGDKLRYAKQAGLDLLGRLEPQDRVTLISYDSDVVTHAIALPADAGGITRLRGDLLQLSAGTATALGPALFEGLTALGRQDHGDRLSHVLLLSDGLANEGEQRPEVIAARVAQGYQHGTTVSSLGMGIDYNEDLMTDIADQGGGRYHFIEDADHIPAVLADELAGLTSSVAADLSVDFAAAAPTRVDAVHGYVSTQQAELTAIRVGYLGAGQTREIMARLEVPDEALAAAVGDTLELGLITVRFRPLLGDGKASEQLVELQLPASVTLAGSSDDARRSEHTEVTIRVYEIEAAATLRLATEAVDRGDFAGATQLYGQQERVLLERLESASDEVEREQLREEMLEFEAASEQLEQAQHSQAEAKLYSKQYKASSYSKGKGSKKKSK